jgi:hypothetical protein
MSRLIPHFKSHFHTILLLVHAVFSSERANADSNERNINDLVLEFEHAGETKVMFEIIRSRFRGGDQKNSADPSEGRPIKEKLAGGAVIALRLLLALEHEQNILQQERKKTALPLLFFMEEQKRRTDQPFIHFGATRPDELPDPVYRKQYEDFLEAQKLDLIQADRDADLSSAHRSLSQIVLRYLGYFTKEEQETIRRDAARLRTESLKGAGLLTPEQIDIPKDPESDATVAQPSESLQGIDRKANFSTKELTFNTKPTAETQIHNKSSLPQWSIIVVLIVATTGLLWSLVKRRR